jgi:hypothetical protein
MGMRCERASSAMHRSLCAGSRPAHSSSFKGIVGTIVDAFVVIRVGRLTPDTPRAVWAETRPEL